MKDLAEQVKRDHDCCYCGKHLNQLNNSKVKGVIQINQEYRKLVKENMMKPIYEVIPFPADYSGREASVPEETKRWDQGELDLMQTLWFASNESVNMTVMHKKLIDSYLEYIKDAQKEKAENERRQREKAEKEQRKAQRDQRIFEK